MSSQRGNINRTRPQKHQNKAVFKNNLHDTSKRTKEINSLEVTEVCKQCKDVIEWKIKYKKYKPLTQLKTCANCHLKTIKFAYHTLCQPCGSSIGVCCKCRQSQELVQPSSATKTKADILSEMEGELKLLSERKRRSFYRYLDNLDKSKKKKGDAKSEGEPNEINHIVESFEQADPRKAEVIDGSNPDYLELVRRRLELLGRQVLENEFEDDLLDYDNCKSNDSEESE